MRIRDRFPVDGKRHEIEYESSDVSAEAYEKIKEWCRLNFGIAFGSIVGSAWNDPGNENYPGTLPKRISAWYYKNHGIHVRDTAMKYIGDIAAGSICKLSTFQFDFVDQFRWTDGEFGDPGSCVMTTKRARWLELYGALAMRFFNNGCGIGRCWIVFPGPDDDYYIRNDDGNRHMLWPRAKEAISNKIAITCNAYSNAGGLSLEKISAILRKFLDVPMFKCDMSSYDKSIMYVNIGRKYALGSKALEGNLHVTLNWTDTPIVTCDSCGKRRKLRHDKDYKAWCDSCFQEKFKNCYMCGNCGELDDMISFKGAHVCRRCGLWIKACFICGERDMTDMMRAVSIFGPSGYHRDEYICRKHPFANCTSCGKYLPGCPCPHAKRANK